MSNLLSNYDYELPPHLIAQTPLERRVDARLMVVSRREKTITHLHVRDLPSLIMPQDSLVFNNSKVVRARLIGKRVATGGRWEGLFISCDDHGFWKVMSKTRGKLRSGELLALETPEGRMGITLQAGTPTDDGCWIVKPEVDEPTFKILDRVGWVPIPPYIRAGRMMPADAERYQTVYAKENGSIAAPTAGLHFSPPLLQTLREQGTVLCPLTLHVGIGTFKPIAAATLEEHAMHSEYGTISEDVVEKLRTRRASGGRIIAVGTTSMRVLETAARDGTLKTFSGMTNLFIHPPFTFHAVDALLTNFHFPRSSLLVLVRTFGGDLIRRAYTAAIAEEYRFYSYGDCMLIV